MINYQILKRNKFLSNCGCYLVAKRHCADEISVSSEKSGTKIKNINFCHTTEIENMLSLSEDRIQYQLELNELGKERELILNEMFKTNSTLNIRDKLWILKNKVEIHKAPHHILEKFTKPELIKIIDICNRYETCNTKLTHTLTLYGEKAYTISAWEKNNYHIKKAIELFLKKPAISLSTTVAVGTFTAVQYFEAGKVLIKLPDKIIAEEKTSLEKYKNELKIIENLGYFPSRRFGEPF